jgi:hypothetical protein
LNGRFPEPVQPRPAATPSNTSGPTAHRKVCSLSAQDPNDRHDAGLVRCGLGFPRFAAQRCRVAIREFTDGRRRASVVPVATESWSGWPNHANPLEPFRSGIGHHSKLRPSGLHAERHRHPLSKGL